MARIRSVHPSLFTDEAWVSCSPLARVLYIGLMTDADDQGLFEWKPLQIRMRLLAGDNADTGALLDELAAVNLIAQLEAGGKKLGAIRYFRRFQRPKKPNSVFVLPAEWRTYVGLVDDGSEPPDDDSEEVPPEGEKSPQMEDVGGVGREKDKPSLSPGKPVRAKGRASPIEEGFPDKAAVASAAEMIAASGVRLDPLDHAKRFRSHAKANDRRVVDWRAAWLGWIEIEIGKAPEVSPEPAALEPFVWSGPADLWAAAVGRMGEEWARGYLGKCEARGRALFTTSKTIEAGLRREIGRELTDLGASVVVGSPPALATENRRVA